MANVRVVNLAKYFGDTCALNDLSLDVKDKRFVTLLGPSGCGKSTALNLIAGLESPSSGEIYLDDLPINRVPPTSRDVAMVFQNYALYPHMNVRKNLSFGLKIRKIPKPEINKKIEAAARMLGIQDLMNRKPRELSGGQRQRVAIGRAIVRDPKAFLLDEPLSNLDASLRVQMRAELKLLFSRLEATVIYVTHDQAEAMTMSDEIAVLRDGELQQMGTPLEIYYKPVNRFVAGFVGSPSMNFVKCNVVRDGSRFHLRAPDFELFLAKGQLSIRGDNFPPEVIVGIRPEDLSLESQVGDQEVRGTCIVVERMGPSTILMVRTGENTLTLQVPGACRVKAEDDVQMRLDSSSLYVFDGDSGRALLTPQHLTAEEEDHWPESSTIRSQ